MSDDHKLSWHNQYRPKKEEASCNDVNPVVAFLMPILSIVIIFFILTITVVTMHK